MEAVGEDELDFLELEVVLKVFGGTIRASKVLAVAADYRDGPLFVFREVPEEIRVEGLLAGLFLPVVKLHFEALFVLVAG